MTDAQKFAIDCSSQLETVMTLKLTESLLKKLKDASQTKITITFQKGKATLAFNGEVYTLTDRKEKKKHQCFYEDPKTHTFKVIGFVTRKLQVQQTLTQSIQEKVINQMREAEEQRSSAKSEILDSDIKQTKPTKETSSASLKGILKNLHKGRITPKSSTFLEGSFSSTTRQSQQHQQKGPSKPSKIKNISNASPLESSANVTASLSAESSENTAISPLPQKRTLSTANENVGSHRRSETQKGGDKDSEPARKRQRSQSSPKENINRTQISATSSATNKKESITQQKSEADRLHEPANNNKAESKASSSLSVVIDDLEKVEFDEQTKPELKPEIKTVEELKMYHTEWNAKYPLYKKIYQVLQQNTRDFVRLGEAYYSREIDQQTRAQIANQIEKLFNQRKGEIHRLRTKYRMLHEELSSLRNRINQFVQQQSNKFKQRQLNKE
jgi:hypothetical protein